MKIFATVGHTYYNALFKAIDDQLPPDTYQVKNQISEGTYIPQKHRYFKYSNQFEHEISEADVVITHAGAGSVFHLLEICKPILIVPNCDRIDNHQEDLANFIIKNNYACVCRDLANLEAYVLQAFNGNFNQYEKHNFCGYNKIIETIAMS